MKKKKPINAKKGSIIGYSEANFATLIGDNKPYIDRTIFAKKNREQQALVVCLSSPFWKVVVGQEERRGICFKYLSRWNK